MEMSESMNKEMYKCVRSVCNEAIAYLGGKYGFKAEEEMENMFGGSKSMSISKSRRVYGKRSIPLPYNGECNEVCCQGLRRNNGLYTQCTQGRVEEGEYCKSCQQSAEKNNGIPEYGNIKGRQAMEMFEYIDPKGRKQTPYTKVMRKYKINEEEVLEEAGKVNMTIHRNHFVVAEKPKREKAEKKEKGSKGRPKKTKKVVEVSGEDEDLFATLVASANAEEEEEDDETAAAKKAEKETKLAAKKAEKEAEKAAKQAEKDAAKEAAKQTREAILQQKKKAEEDMKAAKDALKAAKEAAASKKPKKKPEEEALSVIKFKEDGKKYLRTKTTGIVYDYEIYKTKSEQVVVGQWDSATEKIVFKAADESSDESDGEESEEEYEDD